jgi:hypothetical protein
METFKGARAGIFEGGSEAQSGIEVSHRFILGGVQIEAFEPRAGIAGMVRSVEECQELGIAALDP